MTGRGTYAPGVLITGMPAACTFSSYCAQASEGIDHGDVRMHKRSYVLTSPFARAMKACGRIGRLGSYATLWDQ